jgi:hypothetical protein
MNGFLLAAIHYDQSPVLAGPVSVTAELPNANCRPKPASHERPLP